MGKKRLRDMTWEDYGISKNRYKELRAFCLQYDEKKSRVRYGVSSIQSDGVPGSNFKESPVERQAIENNALAYSRRDSGACRKTASSGLHCCSCCW